MIVTCREGSVFRIAKLAGLELSRKSRPYIRPVAQTRLKDQL